MVLIKSGLCSEGVQQTFGVSLSAHWDSHSLGQGHARVDSKQNKWTAFEALPL